MLASIDCYTKELEQYRPFEAELLPAITAYYRVGLTYSSTALEGFSYTESETKVLLEEGLTVGGKPLRDALAVTGHAKAYDYMFSLLHQDGITVENILFMHSLLEGGLESGTAGQWRTKQVFVTGSDFVFPAAAVIEQQIQNFSAWLEQASTTMHPVTFAVKVHLNLVSIHPFADGNGRIARLAMNTVLIQHGYLPLLVPPLLRAEYIAAIQKAQTKRNENDFLDFMYRREVESCKEMLRLLKGSKDVPLF